MDHPRIVVMCLVLASLAIALLVALPSIVLWEHNAGYPYGKLCDTFNSCERK